MCTAGTKGACRRSPSIGASISRPIRTSRRRMSIRSRISCAFGVEEGRQPFAPTELVAANGFDYVYYLQNNPDVAAARCRSVPALPDRSAGRRAATRTRCSTPTAILRPMPTWRRRTSIRSTTTTRSAGTRGAIHRVGFDTTRYLAAYPDVAAAQRQSARALPPLRHPRGPVDVRGRRVGVAIRAQRTSFRCDATVVSYERRSRSSAAVAETTLLPSRPEEFHPEPLTDPDVILSHHPARATARRLPPSVERRALPGEPVGPNQRR